MITGRKYKLCMITGRKYKLCMITGRKFKFYMITGRKFKLCMITGRKYKLNDYRTKILNNNGHIFYEFSTIRIVYFNFA